VDTHSLHWGWCHYIVVKWLYWRKDQEVRALAGWDIQGIQMGRREELTSFSRSNAMKCCLRYMNLSCRVFHILPKDIIPTL
jgi:hypothetical protein